MKLGNQLQGGVQWPNMPQLILMRRHTFLNCTSLCKNYSWKKPDISKFEYALSTILLPPPKPAEPSVDEADVYYAPYIQSNVYDENLFENSEDNAYVFYAPYLQNMYKYGESSYQSKETLPENTEDDADLYYKPYMLSDNTPQILSSNVEEEAGDDYYISYMNYNTAYLPYSQQDQWFQYYNRQPLPETHEVYQDLPQHDTQNLYDGPVNDYISSEEESLPPTYENEIFDVPKAILKVN